MASGHGRPWPWPCRAELCAACRLAGNVVDRTERCAVNLGSSAFVTHGTSQAAVVVERHQQKCDITDSAGILPVAMWRLSGWAPGTLHAAAEAWRHRVKAPLRRRTAPLSQVACACITSHHLHLVIRARFVRALLSRCVLWRQPSSVLCSVDRRELKQIWGGLPVVWRKNLKVRRIDSKHLPGTACSCRVAATTHQR